MQYHMYLATLYDDMAVEDCYVAIEDMMKHMISSQHVCVSTTHRYQYSPSLLEYIHQVTPSPAKIPPAKEIIEVDEEEDIKDEFDFSKVQEEATKDEEWITKERKDRDQRNNAREKTRARLTKDKKEAPPPIKDYSLLESDDEEERVVETIETVEEAEDEDDAISRLGLMEQELLQEQEETKSEVLGENNTDSHINDMIERKLTKRFDRRMETEWKQKLDQVTEDAAIISRKADRVMQMESRGSI